MKKRVAVTGARGLLGATLMREFAEKFDVVALHADIRDAVALRQEVAELGNGAWIIHTAAMTNVAACEKDPATAFAINSEGTNNVITAARETHARVLYVSTASVFSGKKGNYAENDVPEPLNVHNTSKVKGEEYVKAYDGGIILRLNLIGIHPAGSRGKNFFEWIYDSLRENKDMTLFEDVLINPLSNWTIAKTIGVLIESKILPRILHIASSDVRSKADIGEMVARRFPKYYGTIRRASVDTADGVVRPKHMWLSDTMTRDILGLTAPSVSDEVETVFTHVPL